MDLLCPSNLRMPDQGFDDVLKRLDELVASGWREAKHAVADAMLSFRSNGLALRRLAAAAIASGKAPPLQGAQSFLLADRPDYAIRINMWFPLTGLARTNDRYRRYLSIDELHNHDFDFFSICLSGPGYTSLFYREEVFDPDRSAGERVPLEAPRVVSLTGDDVLFVEKEKDYHAQQWPTALTTTLNVIPRAVGERRVQYVLDAESLSIRDVIRA
ncbi:hypothetical protein [Sphingomonas zeae]